jgi:lysophospholipase L1-like esterase
MNKQILCFGDSLTDGKPGVTYLNYLKNKKYSFNFGLGGDTLIGMMNRLEKVLLNPKYQHASDIVIEIGANDILSSFLSNYSRLWKIRIKMLIKRGSIPCENEFQFEEEYLKLIRRLKEYHFNITIISIPYFECTINELNNKIVLYNNIIKKICYQFNITYIDFRSWQETIKEHSNNKGAYFMQKNPLTVGFDTLLTSYLPFRDYISNKRGLALTVDGCHLNSFSAERLAQMVDEVISFK